MLPLPRDRWFYFVYLNNWWPLLKDTWHGNIIGHFWSLAVEEQFYLLWPLCVWLLPRKKLPWVAAFGIAIAVLIRCVLYYYFRPSRSIVENTFARMDTLLMGALMAMLVRSPRALRSVRPYLYGIAAASLSVYIWFNTWGVHSHFGAVYRSVVQFSLIAIIFSAVVLYAFATRDNRSTLQAAFCRPLLRRVGKYSYGMYVYHVPIMPVAAVILHHLVSRTFNGPGSVAFIIGIILLTYAVAKLSFEHFESRFLKQKKRFSPQEPVVKVQINETIHT